MKLIGRKFLFDSQEHWLEKSIHETLSSSCLNQACTYDNRREGSFEQDLVN